MMKTIVVSAGASRESGAKTIYLQFINHLKDNIGEYRYFIFVDDSMPCPDIKGVEYIKVDVKSWKNRIFFDYYKCEKLLELKGIEPNLVISLQNTGVWCLRNVPHLIYYHQPLPLYPNTWSFFKKDERTLALYKSIYPLFVRLSFKRSNTDFIAQIPFIADGIEEKFGINRNHIHILFPDVEKVEIDKLDGFIFEADTYNFIYPAVPVRYKEHNTLIEALRIVRLKDEEMCKKIRIHFTISENQTSLLDKIHKYSLSENFVFHGVISHLDLLSMLNASLGLLFPSTIETLGLPLLEAASLGKTIIVSDMDYAHQVIGNYKPVCYVKPYDYKGWADFILVNCRSEKKSHDSYNIQSRSSWYDFFDIVDNKINNN